MRELDQKLVMVTGAAGMLGACLVREFCSAGTTVVACDRNLDKLHSLTQFKNVYPLGFDMLGDFDANKVVTEVKRLHGRVPDALVANASNRKALPSGGGMPTNEEFVNIMQVDLLAHLRLAEAIVEKKVNTSSISIVWISSIYGTLGVDPEVYPDGMPHAPLNYGVVKGGVESLVHHLACKWGVLGVRVNAVVAGGILNRQRQSPSFIERFSRKVPLGRLANVEEIVRPILFLASEESSYITGTNLRVDGGYSAW